MEEAHPGLGPQAFPGMAILSPTAASPLRYALNSATSRRIRSGVRYRQAKIFEVSARNGDGLNDWFDYITSTSQVPRGVMDVDYEVYADGEARLGWLNCTVRLAATEPCDGSRLRDARPKHLRAHSAWPGLFDLQGEMRRMANSSCSPLSMPCRDSASSFPTGWSVMDFRYAAWGRNSSTSPFKSLRLTATKDCW